MNKEPESPAPAPNLVKPLLIFAALVFLVFVYLGWQNYRQKQLAVEAPPVELMPTPSFTASDSATSKTNQIANVTEPAKTTKGGQVLGQDQTVEPTPTPTTSPTPSPTPTPSFVLDKIYLDSQFNYQIRFNDDWIFRRTHGTNTSRESDAILSRAELNQGGATDPNAQVVILIRKAGGEVDLEGWLKDFRGELNFATGTKLTFAGVPAIIFTKSGTHETETLYFVYGAYGYQINAWEKGPLSSQTRAIRDSFRPE
jgi:hypothetical protein